MYAPARFSTISPSLTPPPDSELTTDELERTLAGPPEDGVADVAAGFSCEKLQLAPLRQPLSEKKKAHVLGPSPPVAEVSLYPFLPIVMNEKEKFGGRNFCLQWPTRGCFERLSSAVGRLAKNLFLTYLDSISK